MTILTFLNKVSSRLMIEGNVYLTHTFMIIIRK